MIEVSNALRRALARHGSEAVKAKGGADEPTVGADRIVITQREPAEAIEARDFVEVRSRRYDGGRKFYREGLWSGVGTIRAPVINPRTGRPQTKTFVGAASLLEIGPISRTRNLSIPNLDIALSQLSPQVLDVLQGHDARGARVRVWRAVFLPATGELVDAAFLRFSGSVQHMELTTPDEGELGRVAISCTSDLQAISRSNPVRRSDSSQRDRLKGDAFFQDAGTAGALRINWGGTTAEPKARQTAGRHVSTWADTGGDR